MTAQDDEHRRLRELLGAYALGGLPQDESAGLRAHLDGCADCRAELAEIAPLAAALRGVDPDALSDVLTPPPDLGDRIRLKIAEEQAALNPRTHLEQRRLARRRSTRRLAAAAAIVGLCASALGVGAAIGRSTAPELLAQPAPSSSAPVIPVEQVALTAAAGISADQAALIAHTWGVEARFEAAGFAAGRVYRAAFRAVDGRLVPAGEFLGTGSKRLKCNMQSALLRTDAVGFVVTDSAGAEVLSAAL